MAGLVHLTPRAADQDDEVVLRPRGGDPLGAIRAGLEHKPLSLSLAYVAASVFFVAALTYGLGEVDTRSVHIANYSHISIPTLAVGLAFLPTRLFWLAFLVFAGSFVAVEISSLFWSNSIIWSPLCLLLSAMIATLSGLAGGLAARMVLVDHERGRPHSTPERAAVYGGVALAVTGILFGSGGLLIEEHGVGGHATLMTEMFLLAQRMVQLGLVSAGAMLLFFGQVKRDAVPEILVQMAVFALLGWMAAQGYSLAGGLDLTILALGFLLLRPIYASIGGVLGGVSLYVMLTGQFVDLPLSMTVADIKLDAMTNVMFVVLVIVGVQRVRVLRLERAQHQTLGRMARAQELARFGYFLYDTTSQGIHFDPLAQRILGVGAACSGEDFLQRLHPDDRDSVSRGATTPTDEGRSFSFRFAVGGPWTTESPTRHFTGFARYEAGVEGRSLAYGIVVDVTQEHAQEEHLRLVLAELSERQGQQTQLFSMISHELRTPAAIISMIADELDEGRSWRDCGPQMRAVLDQLLSILSDMRQTVRPEQNLPIRIEAFRPQDLAEAVRDSFRTMAASRGMQINLYMEAGADQMRSTDKVRLNQTLSNLVKNAILHSQATEVTIRYSEKANMVGTWTVSDNGRNIAPAQRERLFQPFVRNSASAAKVDGSGLGLYIAKGAIELLGGSIDYVDRPMSGAEFVITLPMKAASQSEPAQVDAARASAHTLALSKLSALVVEDSETMGGLLVARLSKMFAEVKWVRDGVSGLAWTNLHSPDVVISDLFMPGLGGDEMALKLRQRGYDRPIIGMTATDIGEEVERFRRSGANAVITKPIRPQDLELALAGLI